MPKKSTKKTYTHVKAEDLQKKVKAIIREGNVRSITISNNTGKVIARFPLTFGIVGLVIAPMLAVVGTLAALVTDLGTITVEKNKEITPSKMV